MLTFEIIEKYEFSRDSYYYLELYPLTEDTTISCFRNMQGYFILKMCNNKTEVIKIEKTEGNKPHWFDTRFIKIGGRFALLQSLKCLYFLSDDFQITDVVEVDTTAVKHSADGIAVANLKSSYHIGVGEGNTLPLVLTNGRGDGYDRFCYLVYDELSNRAAVKNIFILEANSFPATASKGLPLLHHLMLKQDRLYLYVVGSQHTKYFGQNYSTLVIANLNRNLQRTVFCEDYEKINDQKKRGKYGVFTTSAQYCIIIPLYQGAAYDSWQGKQRLYDLNADDFLEIKLPKGFSKIKMINHFSDKFWFEYFDRKSLVRTLYAARSKSED